MFYLCGNIGGIMKRFFVYSIFFLLFLSACGDPYSVYGTWVPEKQDPFIPIEFEITGDSFIITAAGDEQEVPVILQQNKENPKLWRFQEYMVPVTYYIKFEDENTIIIDGWGRFVRD